MFKFFIGPMIIGILAFLVIYFISPLIFSESDTVSIVAGFTLNFSNLYFESMPPGIASYINNLNLAVAGITVGLFLTLVVHLVVVVWSILFWITKWIVSYLQKDRKKEEASDLPPIDMESGFESSEEGNKVLGRGLDSIDRD